MKIDKSDQLLRRLLQLAYGIERDAKSDDPKLGFIIALRRLYFNDKNIGTFIILMCEVVESIETHDNEFLLRLLALTWRVPADFAYFGGMHLERHPESRADFMRAFEAMIWANKSIVSRLSGIADPLAVPPEFLAPKES